MLVDEHLSDRTTYTQLNADDANTLAKNVGYRISIWIDTHKECLSKDEHRFITHHLRKAATTPFSIFYGMMKVHKQPLRTRPVVSYSGSIAWALGVWIDSKLQLVAQQQKSYFKDSFELKKCLDDITIEPNDRLFTADAVSMYTNIPTSKGLKLISNYLQHRFSQELPVKAIVEALDIVMNNNLFQFGDMFFKQNTGTAMGAPPAPPWATIYMALSENQFLPHHKNLKFYRRFIDDIIGIWKWDGDLNKWDYFKKRLNNPVFELDWEISDLKTTVDFMDLTISLEGTKIVTSLYEKPNNLHLFIPSKSCHPPGLLKGMINGYVYRINQLCTKPSVKKDKMQSYFNYLLARGYDPAKLSLLFHNAQLKKPVQKKTDTDGTKIFFHMKFHPKNIHPSTIQKIWKNTVCSPAGQKPLREIENCYGIKTGIDTLVISQSRSPNLGNLLSYRKLKDTGPPASSYMD